MIDYEDINEEYDEEKKYYNQNIRISEAQEIRRKINQDLNRKT